MRPPRAGRVGTLACWLALALVVAACVSVPAARPPAALHGDPRLGQKALIDYGCVACHTIPGIRGADGLVGPPLDGFSRRAYIAGQLPNSEANLVRWITDPDDIEPGTAMPDLGVSDEDALNISAYLLSLD